MKKPIFLHGLGKNNNRNLLKYFTVPKIDWNNEKITPLGCMVASIYAEKRKVDTLIFCSPSPDETLENIKANKIIFLYGEKEKWVKENIYRMVKTLNCDYKIIEVKGASHKIDKNYLVILLDILNNYA